MTKKEEDKEGIKKEKGALPDPGDFTFSLSNHLCKFGTTPNIAKNQTSSI